MKKFTVLALFFILLATTGSSCKKDSESTPAPTSGAEQGSALTETAPVESAPPADGQAPADTGGGSAGEAAEVKDDAGNTQSE